MRKLTLEDIRECNGLTKEQMASIMEIEEDKYDFYNMNTDKIGCYNISQLCSKLNIELKYITH